MFTFGFVYNLFTFYFSGRSIDRERIKLRITLIQLFNVYSKLSIIAFEMATTVAGNIMTYPVDRSLSLSDFLFGPPQNSVLSRNWEVHIYRYYVLHQLLLFIPDACQSCVLRP